MHLHNHDASTPLIRTDSFGFNAIAIPIKEDIISAVIPWNIVLLTTIRFFINATSIWKEIFTFLLINFIHYVRVWVGFVTCGKSRRNALILLLFINISNHNVTDRESTQNHNRSICNWLEKRGLSISTRHTATQISHSVNFKTLAKTHFTDEQINSTICKVFDNTKLAIIS